MAAEAPDPRTFKTWEDAFQYPVPVVRKLEQQLRSNAGENREKLRSLVGTSYRDLLSTAETIIDMEIQMQKVESRLARVGQNCNSRTLDRISQNAAKSHKHNQERETERYAFASQLAVLRNCPVVMARLMKGEGRYLLIAKVLVISRLLHKALSQRREKEKAPIVDALRDKLGSLRSRLLRRIDKRLKSAAGDTEALVESMCAYSLATSSTPTDVLRHFHHVRMEAIAGLLQHEDGLKEHGIRALKLCLQTVQDTQAVFPRRLADALAKLKIQPLVQDPDVRALYELNLDIHDRWVGEEARNYTPWPRHDELQRAEAEKLLHQWSKQAIAAFLKGIKKALAGTMDLKEVAELRQELVETWILSGSRMAGVKSKNVLDDLRDAMNGQLENIVRSRAQILRGVVELITETLGGWDGKGSALSLWSATAASSDLSDGAKVFKEQILDTHQGRDNAVIHVVDAFDKWMESVLQVKGIVKSMKETRWDDPFTDDVELDDSDDEFGGDSKQTLLSDDDPRLLEEVTHDALTDALSLLGKSFTKIVGGVNDAESEDGVNKAIFILRVVREISERIPRLKLNDRSTAIATPFTIDVLEPLHAALAEQVVQPTVEAYKKSLAVATKRRSKSNILWEGHPALPAQPSPSAFRFLQELVRRMGGCGSDLWAQEGVKVLKDMTRREVAKVWQSGVEAMQKVQLVPEKPSTEPAESAVDKPDSEAEQLKEETAKANEGAGTEEVKTEKLKQLLFDVLYIKRYLSTPNSPAETESLVGELQKASGIDEGEQARLKKNASDYARKTYLLFALLA